MGRKSDTLNDKTKSVSSLGTEFCVAQAKQLYAAIMDGSGDELEHQSHYNSLRKLDKTMMITAQERGIDIGALGQELKLNLNIAKNNKADLCKIFEGMILEKHEQHRVRQGDMLGVAVHYEQSITNGKLSVPLIAAMMLKHAAEDEDGALPNSHTWPEINRNGYYGVDLPERMDIATIKDICGWKNVNTLTEKFHRDLDFVMKNGKISDDLRQGIDNGVKEHQLALEASGKGDRDVEMSLPILVRNMLFYVDETKDSGKSLSLPDKNSSTEWRDKHHYGVYGLHGLDKGMDLNKAKEICGWKTKGVKARSLAEKDILATDLAYFREHGDISEDLLDRLERGVAEHIADLDAANDVPKGTISQQELKVLEL